MNQCNFIGNVGRDPEAKSSKDGSQLWAEFSIGVNKKLKGEKTTQWINCLVFGASGDNVLKYVKKGSKVFVSGEGDFTAYLGKDGSAKVKTSVVVKTWELVSSKEVTEASAELQPLSDFNYNPAIAATAIDSMGEIPF